MQFFVEKSSSHILFLLLLAFVTIEKGMQWKGLKGNDLAEKQFTLPEVQDLEFKKQGFTLDQEFFPEEEPAQMSGVYFLKFYGSGKNTHSRIVKVKREFKGSLKKRVKMALRYLESGPIENEAKKGLLSGFPEEFKFKKKIRFQNGILYISLPESFLESAGAEILQDRIDQLLFTLFENPEIQGVSIFINEKKIAYIGDGMLPVGGILKKPARRVVNF